MVVGAFAVPTEAGEQGLCDKGATLRPCPAGREPLRQVRHRRDDVGEIHDVPGQRRRREPQQCAGAQRAERQPHPARASRLPQLGRVQMEPGHNSPAPPA
ncbi:hypothetical protein ACFQYP_33115 [Nonomuraea antimicrobica]